MRPVFKSLIGATFIVALVGAAALATPQVDGAVFNLRVFNDCPTSVLETVNNYPTLISISDSVLDCEGWANLHNWHLAVGGASAVFNNDDAFTLSFDLRITGAGEGEAGVLVAPWWSQNVDGRFNVRSTDGEIACFGGRLPFYSFTASHGIAYAKGDVINLKVIYTPNDLTEANPADIEYVVEYNGGTYSSGRLLFDEGNPAEDPPFGLWGMLNDARVGGYMQAFLQSGNPAAALMAEWMDIEFLDMSVATEATSWSMVKSLY
ncbi:MAG: hypothetical protein JW819_12400 [Candidatus Krumholzibacteriota bacterium]|nr:hypothetical protein [Candidatus Krumholzibacteriota bacterium]